MYYLIKNHIMFGLGGESFSVRMIAKSREKESLSKLLNEKLETAIKSNDVELINLTEKQDFVDELSVADGKSIDCDDELQITYKSDGFDRVTERYSIVDDDTADIITDDSMKEDSDEAVVFHEYDVCVYGYYYKEFAKDAFEAKAQACTKYSNEVGIEVKPTDDAVVYKIHGQYPYEWR